MISILIDFRVTFFVLETKQMFSAPFGLFFLIHIITGSHNERTSAHEHVDECMFADNS